MGITIKYKGLKDEPILITGQGRYPATRREEPAPDLTSPSGLYRSANHSQLHLSLQQAEQKRVLSQVERRVDELAGLLDSMHLPPDNLAMVARTAVSPQPRVLAVQADDQATAPTIHTIEVQWPARGGEVLSDEFNPVAPVELDDGTHSFYLTIDGTQRQLSVTVNNNSTEVDTQEEFLGRLARAIDGVDYRVSARVERSLEDAYDPAPRSRPLNRVVRLKVSSAQEGQGVEFYFSDTSSGSLVQTYGLDSGTPPRPARMRLLGELRDQSTSAISIDNGHLTGSARGDTAGPAQVPVTYGAQVFQGELINIISKYNNLVSYLDAHADLLRPSLKDRIIRPLEERARSMPAIGLRATVQGKLLMSPAFKDQVAYDYGSVRRILTGQQGWTESLKAKLKQLQEMDLSDFARELDIPSQTSARRRAWDLVYTLSSGIINGYY